MPVPLVPLAGAAFSLGSALFNQHPADAGRIGDNAAAEQAVRAGDQAALDHLVTYAGWNCCNGIAPTQAVKDDAKQRVIGMVRSGVITGPLGSGEFGGPDGCPCLLGQYVIAPSASGAATGGAPMLSAAFPATGKGIPPLALLAIGIIVVIAVLTLVKGR